MEGDVLPPPPLQVLLWVLVSVLPLVDGAHMRGSGSAVRAGSDSRHTEGLLGDQDDKEFPVTLPEVVEDKKQEDDIDPYSTWHALYGTETLLNVESSVSCREQKLF